MAYNATLDSLNYGVPNWTQLPPPVVEVLAKSRAVWGPMRRTCKAWRDICSEIITFISPRYLPQQLNVVFPKIYQLHVDFAPMGGMPLNAGLTLANLAHLRILAIYGVQCSEETYLTPLKRRAELTHFQLSFCDKSATPQQCSDTLRILGDLTTLTHLQVPRLPWISDRDIARLSGLTRLRTLEVAKGGQRITGAGLSALRELPLCHLSLAMTELAGTHLAELRAFTQLQDLNISRCHSLRAGEFGQLATLGHLTKLDVSATKISDEDLFHFVALGKLRKLIVTNCQGVTEAGSLQLIRNSEAKSLSVVR